MQNFQGTFPKCKASCLSHGFWFPLPQRFINDVLLKQWSTRVILRTKSLFDEIKNICQNIQKVCKQPSEVLSIIQMNLYRDQIPNL